MSAAGTTSAGAPATCGPLDRRRPRLFLAIALAFVAVVGTAGASHRVAYTARPFDVVAVLLLLVAPLVVAFALRRRVVAVTSTVLALGGFVLAGYALGPVFGSTEGVLVALVLSGPARSGRIAAWSGLGALALVVPLAFTARDEGVPSPAAVVGGLAWACVVLLLAGALRGRYDRLAERRARARETADRREHDAVTAERLRIARELHDVLAHSLSAISVQAGVGLHLLDRDVEQARSALTQIRSTSIEALGEVRAVLGIVRADAAPRAPAWTLDALPRLVAEFTVPGGPVATLDADLGATVPGRVPPHVAGVAYRVVQESLTNARRHAATATRVDVRVGVDPSGGGALLVCVTDDGPGPSVDDADTPTSGYGLRGMRERVEGAGGVVRAGARADGRAGFEVAASVPFARLVPEDDEARASRASDSPGGEDG